MSDKRRVQKNEQKDLQCPKKLWYELGDAIADIERLTGWKECDDEDNKVTKKDLAEFADEELTVTKKFVTSDVMTEKKNFDDGRNMKKTDDMMRIKMKVSENPEESVKTRIQKLENLVKKKKAEVNIGKDMSQVQKKIKKFEEILVKPADKELQRGKYLNMKMKKKLLNPEHSRPGVVALSHGGHHGQAGHDSGQPSRGQLVAAGGALRREDYRDHAGNVSRQHGHGQPDVAVGGALRRGDHHDQAAHVIGQHGRGELEAAGPGHVRDHLHSEGHRGGHTEEGGHHNLQYLETQARKPIKEDFPSKPSKICSQPKTTNFRNLI